MSYDASLLAENLKTSHFVLADSIGDLTAHAKINGSGTDFMSPRTKLTAEVGIDKFSIGSYNLDSISLKTDMANGKAYAELNSDNPLAKGVIALDAKLNKRWQAQRLRLT